MEGASIYPDFPPQLTEAQWSNLLQSTKDWAIAHGLAVRPSPAIVKPQDDKHGVLATPAPVTLFPSPFPRSCFEEGLAIQQSYNALYAAISSDEEWLTGIVKEIIEVDDFIENLWKVHLKVAEEGYVQDLSLGMFRSDYMVHVDPSVKAARPQIRQVEFNTIASSFGGLSSQVSLLHRHLAANGAYPPNKVISASALPPNSATKDLAEGLAAAHGAYGASRSQPQLPLCVLFVVQEAERNVFDQRHIEYALQDLGVAAFRLPFAETMAHTSIPNENSSRPLVYRPPHAPSTPYEVTTLYFRATYAPSDFPDAGAWHARYQLERSAAIKCPSILTHLAGTKKVQQVLATPSSPHLARFLPDEAAAARVRDTFAAMYPLDDSEAGKHAKQLALSDASSGYVLKPQREGGGNNIYRKDIPDFLRQLGSEERWRGHVLMELIEPPSQQNSLFRDGEVRTGEVIAEFGVYGTCLWRRSGEMVSNKEAGYLLRTKGRESSEGGVAAGFGTVDSACLVDV